MRETRVKACQLGGGVSQPAPRYPDLENWNKKSKAWQSSLRVITETYNFTCHRSYVRPTLAICWTSVIGKTYLSQLCFERHSGNILETIINTFGNPACALGEIKRLVIDRNVPFNRSPNYRRLAIDWPPLSDRGLESSSSFVTAEWFALVFEFINRPQVLCSLTDGSKFVCLLFCKDWLLPTPSLARFELNKITYSNIIVDRV